MQYAMIVNYEFCSNCRSCEISCRKEKGIPLDQWGIEVKEMGPAKFDNGVEWDYVPVPSSLCDMCEERKQEGKKAACELHCLASVIEVLPIEDAAKRMAELSGKSVMFVRN